MSNRTKWLILAGYLACVAIGIAAAALAVR